MLYAGIALCILLLSLERLSYIGVSRYPDAWRARCGRWPLNRLADDPVVVVRRLFLAFKTVQVGVFLAWCMIAAHTLVPLPTAPLLAAIIGLAIIAAGQWLNALVFRQLGARAVFFGSELGDEGRHITGFPFSLIPHPQYAGAVLTVWGFFLVMRYPNPDWMVLPLIETALYIVGARLEA